MSISVAGSYNVFQHYTENKAQRQSTSVDGLNSGKSLPNDDTVSLSARAQGNAQTTPDGMPMMQFNYFGGPPTMVAPQGAGAVEEYAYRRMA
ncbi:hypothetical protein [Neptunicella marina]|uniref:Uncharacterized protein n=1 Tax=Neptunicella marina TaxID=2125989 RepID=A0A8J6ISS5_9ALTE|nr:hypothetical protein [Neptunicella marina]MBC3765057.1 hypothetical protein [Neptunicella marina]